jgi:hypothetical protein
MQYASTKHPYGDAVGNMMYLLNNDSKWENAVVTLCCSEQEVRQALLTLTPPAFVEWWDGGFATPAVPLLAEISQEMMWPQAWAWVHGHPAGVLVVDFHVKRLVGVGRWAA